MGTKSCVVDEMELDERLGVRKARDQSAKCFKPKEGKDLKRLRGYKVSEGDECEESRLGKKNFRGEFETELGIIDISGLSGRDTLLFRSRHGLRVRNFGN